MMIRRYLQRCLCKIRSSKGESIAEVLVAMLVIEMALVMVITMIMSARKAISTSQVTYQKYYDQRNALETRGVITGTAEMDTKNSKDVLQSQVKVEFSDKSSTTVSAIKYQVRDSSDSTNEPKFEIFEVAYPTTSP